MIGELYRELYERSAHGICVTNRNGNVLMANREMGNLTGLSPEDLIGRTTASLCQEGTRKAPGAQAVIETGRGIGMATCARETGKSSRSGFDSSRSAGRTVRS